MRDGANDRTRTCDHTIISRGLYQLSYACIWVLCREAPEREFVFVHSEDTRIKAHRAYRFYLYTAPRVNGCCSIQLLRISSQLAKQGYLHISFERWAPVPPLALYLTQ